MNMQSPGEGAVGPSPPPPPPPSDAAAVDAGFFQADFTDAAYCAALPAALDAAWLEAEAARLQAQLDVVETQLTAGVRRSYGAFVGAMAQVHSLEQTTGTTLGALRATRAHAAALERELVVPALRLLRYTRRRGRLGAAGALLRELGRLEEELAEAQARAGREDYAAALQLLAQIVASGKRVPLAAAKALVARAKQQRDGVVALLQEGRGFPARLVALEGYSPEALHAWLAALEAAGEEWAAPAQRLSLLHRCLLRNVDQQTAAVLALPPPHNQVKSAQFKEAWQAVPAPQLLDAVLRTLAVVSTSLRVQHCVGLGLGPAHAPALASLRARMWTELARRVSLALASKAVYGLALGPACHFYAAANCALQMGRDFGDDAPQYGKLHHALVNVMQRWYRHQHKAELLDVHAALETELWRWSPPADDAQLPPPPPLALRFAYDAALHHPLHEHWSDPFAAGLLDAPGPAPPASEDDDDDDEPRTVGDEGAEREGAPVSSAAAAPAASDAAAPAGPLWNALGRVCAQGEQLCEAVPLLVAPVGTALLDTLAFVALAVWAGLGSGPGQVATSAAVAAFLQLTRRHTVTALPEESEGLLGDLFSASPARAGPPVVALAKNGDGVDYTMPLPAVSPSVGTRLHAHISLCHPRAQLRLCRPTMHWCSACTQPPRCTRWSALWLDCEARGARSRRCASLRSARTRLAARWGSCGPCCSSARHWQWCGRGSWNATLLARCGVTPHPERPCLWRRGPRSWCGARAAWVHRWRRAARLAMRRCEKAPCAWALTLTHSLTLSFFSLSLGSVRCGRTLLRSSCRRCSTASLQCGAAMTPGARPC